MLDTRQWRWAEFSGSQECLKWCRRDLEALDVAVKLTRKRNAAVQAGGNLGVFPKALSAVFRTVYTFEPDAGLFASMIKNAPERNIIKLQAAVGCTHEQVSMECSRRYKKHLAPHEGVTHVVGSGIIPTLRIDDLGLSECDLIYLDIEGYEYFALQGAVETIRAFRPVIGVEVNANVKYSGHSAQELRELILSFGYQCAEKIRKDEIFVPV